jgi:hypothetical protein
LHGIAATRRRGMKRVGKHAEAEGSGKSDGVAQWRFGKTGLADRLIKDRWKRAYHHISSPRSTAELLQYSQGMLRGRECGPNSFTGHVTRCEIVLRSLCVS